MTSHDPLPPGAVPEPDARARARQALFERAEQLLAQENTERVGNFDVDVGALTPAAMREILHDLRVHQIELEMQNEELRTARMSLEVERGRYFDLYDLAPVGYLTINKAGLILRANLTAVTLLGTTRDTLTNLPFTQRVLRDDQDVYFLMRRLLFSSGAPQSRELRLTRPDGGSFWAQCVATVAPRDGGAPVARMVLTDITARKDAEMAQAHAMAELRQMVEGTNDATAMMDAEYRFVVFNAAFHDQYRALSGWDLRPGDTLPETLSHRPADFEREMHQWQRALGGEDFTVTERTEHATQVDGWHEIHFSPIRDAEGRVFSAVRVLRDVTAQQEVERAFRTATEAAESANRAKSEFLANMSHEIRTPLNAILGFAQLLEMEELSPTHREYLADIISAGERLTALIGDILDLSKIEAGRVQLHPADFSLRAVIESITTLLRPNLVNKGLTLQIVVADDVPIALVGDEERVMQLLLNLLVNAIKFTPGGGVSIAAAVRDRQDDIVLLEIAVTDTGIGIPAASLEDIFLPFTQADTSITRRFGGTGLGLAISAQLAELMGGSITCESEVGVGSTFGVLLPLPVGDADGMKRVHAVPAERTPALWPGPVLRVLVAEDHDINRRFTELLLGKMGHTVSAVANGAEVLAAMESATFDLVLMDIQMPILDGRKALAQLREREAADGRHTPVIAVTAFALMGDAERFKAEGFDGYVTKPVLVAHLVSEMQRVLAAAAPSTPGAT